MPCVWQGRSLRLLESGYRWQPGLISQTQQSYATEDHVGCQHDWIRIVFVVIDDKANGEDAATGTTMIELYCLRCHWRQIKQRRCRRRRSGGRRTGQRCRSNVPCAMYRGTTTEYAIYVIAGATRTSNDDVECTEKHEIAILLLCYWCMKEQYYCYLVNTLKKNMIGNLNRLTIPLLI